MIDHSPIAQVSCDENKNAVLVEGPKIMNELEAFHRFLADQITNGGPALTPEDCLELWRAQNPHDEEFRADVQAVKEALDDMEGGDVGMPLAEFLAGVRGKK